MTLLLDRDCEGDTLRPLGNLLVDVGCSNRRVCFDNSASRVNGLVAVDFGTGFRKRENDFHSRLLE